MTRTGRHFLNLGCLKEGGGYNYLGGSYRTGPWASYGQQWCVWGGLEFSMGEPQERIGVNGRDGWHEGPSCVIKGGQGWIRGLNGKIRIGGTLTTCMH